MKKKLKKEIDKRQNDVENDKDLQNKIGLRNKHLSSE